MASPPRGAARPLVVVAVGFALLAIAAPPAAGHAALVASEPADGASLDEAPSRIVLAFSQEVAIPPAAVEVAGDDGDAVPVGAAVHPGGRADMVEAPLPALGSGRYVASWRVTSADGDPITGTLAFRVRTTGGAGGHSGGATSGDATAGDASTALVPGVRDAGAAAAAAGVARFVSFAALALLLGTGLHVLVVAPQPLVSGHARLLLAGSAALLAVAGIAEVASGAAGAAGVGLLSAADPAVLRPFLETTAARSTVLRVLLAGSIAALVLRPVGRRLLRKVAVPTGIGLVATFTAAGHAITGDHVPAAVVGDVVHLGAAGAWIGGLVALLVLGGVRDPAAARRFSGVASWSVAAVVVTGFLAAWRQLGDAGELVSSDYGRLLLAKILLVGGLLAAGAASRTAVRRMLVGRLRTSVAAEAVIAGLVLAVTAVLVGTAPGHDGASPDQRAVVDAVSRSSSP